jgi:hypothetical protein
MVGHESLDTTAIYAKPSEDDMASAIGKLSQDQRLVLRSTVLGRTYLLWTSLW